MKLPRFLILLALFFAFPARAERIVDTDFVAQAFARGAIVWDVRSAPEYRRGHIPGAVNVGDIGKVLRDENTEDYLPLPRLEKILGDAGIDPGREVVVYGAKANPLAYFGLATIEYLGGKSARVYHGGIDDWKAAGRPLTTEPTVLPPLSLRLVPDPQALTTRDMVARLGRPGVQIVDARTPKEYSGEDVRAIRGGHIPGAVNIPFEQNWVDPDAGKKPAASLAALDLKPRDALKKLYAALDPDKETVVYCQSGVRAAETATVLKELGFKNVKVYDSSWLGYGNTLDAPADSATFFNVGLMTSKMNALQQRIDSLEKELATLKGGR